MFKLHMRSLAYATTSFAATLMNTVFNFYYVKIYLNRFHVEESWFHIAQIIFMIWNAINDPLFGYFQDNFSFAWVRSRRHSILYGAPWFALSFLLTWFPWDPTGTSSWIAGLQLLFVLCFYDALFTFVLLAQCALFTEMSSKQEDRFRLVQYSQVASLCASGAVYFCETFSHNLEHFHLFQLACVLIACISCISMYYTGKNAHTQYDLQSQSEKDSVAAAKIAAQTDDGIIKQTLQILLERNFLSFVLMNFCQIFSNTFSDNFSSIICDRLLSSDVFTSGMRSLFYGSLFIVPPMSVILGAPVIGRFGYYSVIRTSFMVSIFTASMLYVAGPSPWALVIYFLVLRVMNCGAFKLFNLALSDIIDEDKARHSRGHPLSSMVFGTNALITKPAISIAPMIMVSILNRHGYADLKTMKDKTDFSNVINADLDSTMFNLLVIVPIMVAVLQLILWSFYKIRDSHNNDKRCITTTVTAC